MSDIAIKVENISKKYQIGENKTYPTLRDKLIELPNRLFKGPKKTKEFWALKDVSFEVKKGEIVGIIGRNGAGKSTMLKILARITEPTSGKVTMYGRVASMLEVGTGFNPELTGRENIYLNGAIIGMTKREITQKFDEIVAFSGVEKFLDTPVKHYSSGMYVRLAFAVAAHLDADILLVDEVLAVGDAEFQKKCLGKIDDLAKSGRTVIFVSHNLASVVETCSRVLIFNSGGLLFDNIPETAVNKYILNSNLSITTNAISIKNEYISRIYINNLKNKTSIIKDDKPIELNIDIEYLIKPNKLQIGCVISDIYGSSIMGNSTRTDINQKFIDYKHVSITISNHNLMPGSYFVSLWLGDGKEDFCYLQNIASFQVVYINKISPDKSVGNIRANISWR